MAQHDQDNHNTGTPLIMLNDQLVRRSTVHIDIEDRSYQFGDGIYEVIRVYNGHTFMLKEHLERLARSAGEIQISLPYHLDELQAKIEELVRVNAEKEAMIYIQVSRGQSERMHGFPVPPSTPQIIAYTRAVQSPVQEQQNGVSATLTDDIRWLRCDIKTVNLLGNVLAKQVANASGAYEAIQHRNGTVTEGSSTNVFIVKDGAVLTHPANHFILNGITRQTILQLCRTLNIPYREETFATEQLLDADEVFISSTLKEIVPVITINDQRIGTGAPGQITRQLLQELQGLITKLHTN